MKGTDKYIWIIILGLLLAGCRRQLSELYNDPDQATEASIPKLLTQILDNNRVRPSYWEIRTFVVLQTGIYSQTVGYLNHLTAYQQNASYTADRWSDFYRTGANGSGILVHYRAMEQAFKEITQPGQQRQQAVYMAAAKIVLLDQATQMVDMWGDIPFFKAGSLGANGSMSYAPFDDGASIYAYALDELRTLAEYFSTLQLTTVTQATFTQQDILLHGDLKSWQQYANALRLRLWMRLADYKPAEARTAVLEIVQNPAMYPLPDGMNYVPGRDDLLLKPLSNYEGDLYLALSELNNISAPHYLLDSAMKPTNDPRIPVFFDKYGRNINGVFVPNTEYNGLPVDVSATIQQPLIGAYAIMDSATFLLNRALPGIHFTAAEVNFLKAEAYQRWGGGDARSYYERAIRQSIAFYFYLNSLNTTTRDPLPPPAEAAIQAFLQEPGIDFDAAPAERLKRIATQKWIHLGFLQSVQAWTEYRRTGFPELHFMQLPLPGFESPPQRLTYPTVETAYNPYYSNVKEQDTRDRKIFWQVK
ncbi:MAG: SusD/RagB family nutrient-binding outer membrane lipoprotein [Chitinophagaceae bacterium]|nr:SusD/RagB family nutrient-binding outer membrane lipoprotein [Chitinophagaceae bacterium]